MTTLIKLDKKIDGEYFKNIKHVLNAHAPGAGEKRQHVLCMYATEKHIVCTDVKRLHTCNNIYGWEPGFYAVIKNLKTSVILIKKDSNNMDCFPGFHPKTSTYPEFENLIKTDHLKPIDFYTGGFNIESNVSFAYCSVFRRTDVIINYEHFKKAVEYIGYETKAFFEDKHNPIVFKSNDKKAVLMPLKE